MKIKDLQAQQGKVDMELDIVDVAQPRQFEKFGRSGRVANAIAKDDSGDIKLTLWNDDIEKVKAGDRVKITNGYVSEWQGELQLGTGKFGKLEVIPGVGDEAERTELKAEQPEVTKEPVAKKPAQKPDESEELGVEEEDIEDL